MNDTLLAIEAEIEWRRRLRYRLNNSIDRAYPDGGESEYRQSIREAGNEADQVSNFENAGIIFQPKQLEFAAWARRADDTLAFPIHDEDGKLLGVPEIGIGGAKGGGKTFALFSQVALDDCQRFPGLKVLYLRKAGNKAREQMEDLVGVVLSSIPHTYTRGRIVFPNGSRIIVGHFQNEKEALNYAGIEYDVIVLEEATQLSLKSYRAIRTAARSSKLWPNGNPWRPRIYNSTNPLGIGHAWYKERFIVPERNHQRVGNRKFIPATVDDNLFVNAEYVGNLDDLQGAERRAYRYGDWDVMAGAYFDTFRYEVHVIPPIEKIVDIYPEIWLSMDYGFAHWNMTYLHTRDSDGNIYTVHELAHRKMYPDEIAPEIFAMYDIYGISNKHISMFLVGADAFAETGHSTDSIASRYAKLNIFMVPAFTGPGSRIKRAHGLAHLLGDSERGKPPRWFITSRCRRLIECLPLLERNPNNLEDVLKVDCDEQGNGGDDPYDGAAMGVYRPRLASIA